jgi:hypothetical protein
VYSLKTVFRWFWIVPPRGFRAFEGNNPNLILFKNHLKQNIMKQIFMGKAEKFNLTVPADYNDQTFLKGFAERFTASVKDKMEAEKMIGVITDESFLNEGSRHILKPGEKYEVIIQPFTEHDQIQLYDIIEWMGGEHKRKPLFVGAQGLALACECSGKGFNFTGGTVYSLWPLASIKTWNRKIFENRNRWGHFSGMGMMPDHLMWFYKI